MKYDPGMNEKEARVLADVVASETGHEVEVFNAVDDRDDQWVVEVRIAKPGSEAIDRYFLWDEDMWEWLGDRIRNA